MALWFLKCFKYKLVKKITKQSKQTNNYKLETMIKKTLKFALCALLLSAAGSAYADGPVTLKDGNTTVSWDDFVAVLNGTTSSSVSDTEVKNAQEAYYGVDGSLKTPTNMANGKPSARKDSIDKAAELVTAKSNYETADKNLSKWQSQLAVLSTEKVTYGWLTGIYQKAQSFETAFDAGSASSSADFYYIVKKDGWGDNVIYISFTGDPDDGQTWTSATPKAFMDYLKTQTVFYALYVYMGDEYKQVTKNDDNLKVSSFTSSTSMRYLVQYAVAAIKTLTTQDDFKYDPNAAKRKELQDNINSLTTEDPENDDKTQLDVLYENYETAQTNADNAKAAAITALLNLQAAEKAYAAAAASALTNYDEVTLTGDVTATVAVTKPYSGHINAGGNVITINLTEGTLFGTNFKNATLENAIINGSFATGTTANNYSNVAAWRGTTGVYYDSDNGTSGTISNIGELAFKYRDLQFFSADIFVDENGGKLVKWSKDNQVYDITLYQTDATTQFYTNLNNGKFVNNPVSEVSPNAFYESKTNDFGNIANVIVGKTCANVVIEDKQSFYCPFDITATNVTLNRKLNAGYNTVCLPFEMTPTNMGLGTSDLLCTYDKETPDKFWFNKTNKVDANTPALVYLANAKELTTLSGVTIKETDKSQLVNYEGATDDPSQACGLFNNTTADDIRGASKTIKVYGLQGGNTSDPKFNPAGTATFGAFRMVIVSEIAAAEAEQGLPQRVRGIAVVDEKGIEINPGEVSGVEIIDMESSSLTVTPGRGEIIITTDANYGMQTVYTMDGKTVATVNVVEGINTVNVPSGIYVVMGQKVMVE